jgi:AcrR family transcriptional regulator
MALNIAPSSDGRRQRSERSQTAIIEAALSLMNEGTLVPTAQQIADRADVGIRSFFRHFADMDSLFLAADEMLISSYEALFEVDDRSGTLASRVTRAISTATRSTSCGRLYCALRRSCGVLPSSEKITRGIRNDCAKSSSCGCLRSQRYPKTGARHCMLWLLSACGIDCASFKRYRPKPVRISSHRW